MATLAIYLRLLILAGLAAVVGCSPNWEELNKLADKQLEASRNWNAAAKEVSAQPSGNAGGEAHSLYQMRMAFFQQDLKANQPDILSPLLSYAYKTERLPLDWFTAIWSSPNTGLILCGAFGCNNSGGGGDVKIIAKDQGSINADVVSGDKSPFVNGDENLTGVGKPAFATEDGMAATNDGQILRDGQGNNIQQVGTDPIPGTNFGSAGDGEGDQGDQNFTPNSSTGLDAGF